MFKLITLPMHDPHDRRERKYKHDALVYVEENGKLYIGLIKICQKAIWCEEDKERYKDLVLVNYNGRDKLVHKKDIYFSYSEYMKKNVQELKIE